MITIELTKQQVKYVILSLEVLIRESEDEFGKLQFIKSESGLASIFKNDIEELKSLKKYLIYRYEKV